MAETKKNEKQKYDRTSYILIVDDDDTLLKFFKIHLNKFFSKVIVVRNAKDAFDTLKSNEIDLVITDVRMPRTDGLQLMKKIKNFDQTIPVLVISGALLSEDQAQIIEEDADDFLKKPFSVDDLHQFMTQGLKKRQGLIMLKQMVGDSKKIKEIILSSAKNLKKDSLEEREKIINQLVSKVNEEKDIPFENIEKKDFLNFIEKLKAS